ncbi:hypothetical protein GCM10009798_22090 [Nocardioides panacihumi]|uniref:Acyltransferase 3 domain-containing protein n=1 Tax=Nocardioides panacihumi TaxID=400774 RepID=A0ABN2R1I1_9ACTN
MPGRGESRLSYRPELDALRGVAVLLVVGSHAGVPGMGYAGTVGVTVFFVLSGWLITRLLLAEHARSGRIDLPLFWQRRARRILPALLGLLFVWSLLGVVSGNARVASPRAVVGALLFVNNWLAVPGDLGALNHTWSLAVEEQFYLVWPLLVTCCLIRGRRSWVRNLAAAGIAVSVIEKALLLMSGAPWGRIYYGTDTRMDALLWGCFLATLAPPSSRGWRRAAVAAAALAVPLLGWAPGARGDLWAPPLAAAVLAGAFIQATVHGTATWIRPPWLVHVGRRSYGLYLWHHAVMTRLLLGSHGMHRVALTVVLLAVSWALAEASWHLLEKRALTRRPQASAARAVEA